MTYAAHEDLIAPARARPQLWRLATGLVLTGAIYTLLVVGWVMAENLFGLPFLIGDGLGQTPIAVLALLGSFALVYPGLILGLRVLHKRGFLGLFGQRRAFLRDLRRALVASAFVFGIGVFLPGPGIGDPQPNLAVARWLGFLPFALAGIAIQITAEEVLFRGYVQSQLAARFQNPLIWLIAPSVLFAALHYAPEEAGPNALILLLPPLVSGLAFADLTARAGNLGPALAVHFINNVAAILIVAPGDTLAGLALYQIPVDMADPAIRAVVPIDLAMTGVTWLAVRLAIRK